MTTPPREPRRGRRSGRPTTGKTTGAKTTGGLPARAAALDLLSATLRRHRPLDESLDAHPGLEKLDGRDRAFARTLVATTLRRLGQIDALLVACIDRPLGHQNAVVEDVLRLGVCQLLFLETPAHAAVSTAVSLLKSRRRAGHGGLVNAVLRRLGREGADLLRGQDAARLNTPDWLWDSWSTAYGEETCRAIAEAHLGEPPLDISVKEDAPGWAGKLGATLLPTGSLRLTPSGPVQALPGFAEGAWWVQDAAAALPARLLGDVKDLRVVDLCAAPGGKTAQLAAAGARVTALDQSAGRLARLAKNMARLGLTVDTVTADAADWRPQEPADAVLLDAPCSATGTLRRHPDAAWLKRPQDIAALAALQDRLLDAAIAMLRPGGLLVYCTCSLQPEEGRERIARVTASGAPVEPVAIDPARIGGLAEAVEKDGTLRTLPHHLGTSGGMDGFFAACLRRR